ncbi:maleylpyruvate isomerase N-terminal domain-containing protein [Lacisediminihabitans changchengi]|uniref:Maleylpyruvate isomerase N-terminal domain-containing protein n=1 Tax=Lacisediminihabitans changchengi TaxID=2787634 RepID=A0A934W5J6_9MICO|nr:maleylpyruvate isomerase N-terminal domain-containing protein [Lacisediminihabitans changchengi]MBK4348585.1 maleylpyruvate isomerase N-terminal domain-containing protein [Lacisediminihabitans changchengi]
MSSAALFARSSSSFLELLGQVSDDQWELPGLGVWTVRSLAGHTARAILTVESYLNQEEPSDITIPSAEAYYSSVFSHFTDAAAVAARGVEAGVWLGSNPAAQVSSALTRTLALVDAQPANRLVSIGGMGILLTEYLRTRVLELVVHTIDLSRATGIRHSLPDATIADALALASATAAEKGQGETVLLALTGRVALPSGFSVV